MKKNKSFALGLMSGTSGDGVSAALAEFPKPGVFRLLGYKTYPYAQSFSRKIASAAALNAAGLSALNVELGELFAAASSKFLKSLRASPSRVAVIGSHGQTIFHGPGGRPPSTLQIGESSVLAESTGIAVVSDFRPRDMAAGGQGAPLLPFFDQTFFGRGPARTLLNLGGIANLSLVGKGVKTLAFDTGPGNCLLDEAVQKLTRGRQSVDKNGALAARGRVNKTALRTLLRHSFFAKRPPKSTGRDIFNLKIIPKQLWRASPPDILATLAEFTARTVYEAHRRFVFPKAAVTEVVVSGGGVFNRALMDRLQTHFAPLPVISIQKMGIHPQAKEPLAFAFFAWEALHGRINHGPAGTGALGPRVLGKITPGARFSGLRAPF